MNKKVLEHCWSSEQQVPWIKEEIYKAIIHGLAVKYKEVIEQAEKLTGKKYKRIHVVGGGARDKTLCRSRQS